MIPYHLSLNKFSYVPETTYSFLVEELINEIPYPANTVTLLLSTWFEQDISSLHLIISIFQEKGFTIAEIVIDSWQEPTYQTVSNIKVTVVNMFAIVSKQLYEIPNPCQEKSGIGLLLAGKRLERLNRIGLLSKLYDCGYLSPNNLVWSFDKKGLDVNKIDSLLLKSLGNIEEKIEYFSQFAWNDADNLHTVNAGEDLTVSCFINHTTINPLYAKTDYSIITETYYHSGESTVTEKTYRAIVNRHPFLMVSNTGTLRYLQSLGFKTFNNYFKNSKYDEIADPNERLTAIVENIIEFPTVLVTYKAEIDNDVAHNYSILNNIVTQDTTVLKNIYSSMGLPITEINSKFELSLTIWDGTEHDVIKFLTKYQQISMNIECVKTYNNIKSSKWPEINSINEFYTLPSEIQEECINVFNFKP
jgi:hypothetical protein